MTVTVPAEPSAIVASKVQSSYAPAEMPKADVIIIAVIAITDAVCFIVILLFCLVLPLVVFLIFGDTGLEGCDSYLYLGVVRLAGSDVLEPYARG